MRRTRTLKLVVLFAAIMSAGISIVSIFLLLEVPHSQVLMDGDKEPKTALQLPDGMLFVFDNDNSDIQNRLKTVAIASGVVCLGSILAFKHASRATET